jgi:acetyl-CoA C-acetyltransferase
MTATEDTTPVIIGVGHVTHRARDLEGTLEPAQLLGRAVVEAATDARMGATGPRIDTIEVLNLLSWQYGDPVGAVAREAGLDGVGGRYSPIGGDQPTLLLDAAARRITAGESDVTVVVGGEALRSRRMWQRAGRPAPWTPRAEPPTPWDPTSGIGLGALEHGLSAPVNIYPLVETARRASTGVGFAADQARSARLWAGLSVVAAGTPGAWSTEAVGAEEIGRPGPDNRWIAHPYLKMMCAQPNVDQAAAVIVASVTTARRLGIPEQDWVWPWLGVGARDTVEVLERPTYARSEPMARVLGDALEGAGLGAADVDLWELYSCFPIVPKLALDMLGIGDDRPISVAGGLTFYGGPFNAYMACAAVNMVRRMRAGEGGTGLLYGNGEYVTKHHALVLGRRPGPFATYPADERAPRQAELDRRPAPDLVAAPTGPATVETSTVVYDRDGAPERGIVIGRLGDGRRFVANIPGVAEQLDRLVDPDVQPVGLTGTAGPGPEGRNEMVLD